MVAIITVSHVFRIRNRETKISSIFYQSCMHSEKFILIWYTLKWIMEKFIFEWKNSSGWLRYRKSLLRKLCLGKLKSKRKAVFRVRTVGDAAGKQKGVGGKANTLSYKTVLFMTKWCVCFNPAWVEKRSKSLNWFWDDQNWQKSFPEKVIGMKWKKYYFHVVKKWLLP